MAFQTPERSSTTLTTPRPAVPQLDATKVPEAAALECDLCIAFETPRSSLSQTPPPGMGAARRLHGRVLEVAPERLLIADAHGEVLPVRLLLPAAVDLGGLRDSQVSLELSHDLSGRRATVDAVLRDVRGRLLLWARDGALPGPRGAHGLAVRVTHDAGRARLVVSARGATASAARGQVAEFTHGRAQLSMAALRIEAEGASFLVVRR